MLSKEAVFKLQDNLLLWLSAKGCASWQQMKKTILNMMDSYDMDASDAYTEYEVLLPLYQLGVIEVCMMEGKINYYIPQEDMPEHQEILAVMKNIPTITKIVTSWEKPLVSNVRYLYSMKSHKFQLQDKGSFEYGICKQDDRIWTDTFYKVKSDYFKLPSYDINTEGFRIAKSKQHIDAGHKILHFTEEEIICNISNTIPIPIIRLMYLACPEMQKDKNNRIMNPIKNFPITDKSLIDQLKRIFEQKE